MTYTSQGGDKMMTATMRLGTGKAYVEFQQSGDGFVVTAHVPGRDPGQVDQTIQFGLTEDQRALLLELVRSRNG